MKILFLTSRLPFPPVGGDKLRTFNFIKYLSKNHSVTLLSFIENERELDCISAFQHFYDRLITIKLPKIKSYQNCLFGIASKNPLQIYYYYSSKMQAAVNKELEQGYDIIFCHLIRMAQYLPKDKSIRKVVDFTDAISLNYKRSENYRSGLFSIINKIEAKRVYSYELATIDKSDVSIFISQVDANYLKNEINKDKLKIISNGVDFQKFKFYQGKYNPNQLVFIGNMRTFPNTDAVLYFIHDVLPLVRQQIPDVKFYVVGTEPNTKILRLHNGKNIFVTGFVESVIPYLNKSAAMVAPMRVGAGIQNKILEALAAGTPVVTTSVGAEGLDAGKLIITNSTKSFAKLIIAVIKNQEMRKKLAEEGRKYIEKKFYWNTVLKKLDSFI